MAGDMFDPVSDADALAWQRRAVDLLRDLLTEATRLGLPPLGWTVHPGLALIGRCRIDPATGRADFDAWAKYLDAERAPAVYNDFGGVTHLRAIVGSALNTSVTVAIEADLFPTKPPTMSTSATTTRDATREEDSR